MIMANNIKYNLFNESDQVITYPLLEPRISFLLGFVIKNSLSDTCLTRTENLLGYVEAL